MLEEWWRRRRTRQAEQELARRRLREEYLQKLEARDPDSLESLRDYGDHDAVPWRVEVGMGLAGLAVLALMVVVVVLVAFFVALKSATGG